MALMPHLYNKTAFASAKSAGNRLIAAYAHLVWLELVLKDHLPTWVSGHRVCEWLSNIGETSLASQLESHLGTLTCRSKNGGEAPVNAHQYPDIRYVLHESDFPGKTTDAQLAQVLDVLSDIDTSLHARGMI